MSHDASEPKSLIDELSQYKFNEDYEDDFEDDVYTDDGELQKAYKTVEKKEPEQSEPLKEESSPDSEAQTENEDNQ